MTKGILWVKLTEESKKHLKELFPPKYEKVYVDHVTLKYDFPMELVPDDLLGQKVSVQLVSQRWNGDVQAAEVTLPTQLAGLVDHSHITISSLPKVAPVRSQDLFVGGQFE